MSVIEYPRSAQSSFVFVFAQRIGEQSAGVGPPGCLGIAQSLERLWARIKALDCRRQRSATFRRIEVAGQLDHGRIVECRVAVERSTGGEDEQRASQRGVTFVVLERDVLSRDVGEDDEVDVASRQAAYSSAIESASSRMTMPSSISSRVIFNGGATMITFQCVIR
jgi:hypothetical protein